MNDRKPQRQEARTDTRGLPLVQQPEPVRTDVRVTSEPKPAPRLDRMG